MALFPTRTVDDGTVTQNRPQYAVARDGRFLVNQPVAEASACREVNPVVEDDRPIEGRPGL